MHIRQPSEEGIHVGWKPNKHELNNVRNALTKQLVEAVGAGRDIKPFQDALDQLDARGTSVSSLSNVAERAVTGQTVGLGEALWAVAKIWWFTVLIGLMIIFLMMIF